MKPKYLLIGNWSGYKASQSRDCHIEKIKYPEKYENLKYIRFTDGTYLNLSIRELKPRERIKENKQYYELIRLCLKYKVCSVTELQKAQGTL
jgi:hypothetical protein